MMKKYVKSFTVFITLFALLSGVFFNTPVKNADAANDPSTFSFWDFVVSEPEATAGDADVASLGDADIENLSATSSLFSDIAPNSAGSYEAETIFNAGIISGFARLNITDNCPLFIIFIFKITGNKTHFYIFRN